MKKFKNAVDGIGVLAFTGAMSIMGLVMGILIFQPEGVTFTSNNSKGAE